MSVFEILLERARNDNTHYPVTVPNGEVGGWSVSEVTLDEVDCDMANLRHVRDGLNFMCVSPGTYKRLVNGTGVMMSNTQMEYRTNKSFVTNARGDVLVFGLGLGMLLEPLHRKRTVTSITVVELSPEVIELVAPHYQHLSKLTIVQGDAFTYEPDKYYDWAYHDIWQSCNDNEDQMKILEQRYAHHAGKQGFWFRKESIKVNNAFNRRGAW